MYDDTVAHGGHNQVLKSWKGGLLLAKQLMRIQEHSELPLTVLSSLRMSNAFRSFKLLRKNFTFSHIYPENLI